MQQIESGKAGFANIIDPKSEESHLRQTEHLISGLMGKKRRQIEKIESENMALLKRLNSVTPSYRLKD